MLKIINELMPFFEDNYHKIHVREYARMMSVSAPTASKRLESYSKEGILKREEDKGYHCYYANRDSYLFQDFQVIYYKRKIYDSGLIGHINNETITPIIVLFGSLAKAEVTSKSDIDIAVVSPTKKRLNIEKYEKRLGREIHLILARMIEELPETLRNSILHGIMIQGRWDHGLGGVHKKQYR